MEHKYHAKEVIRHPKSSAENMTGCLGLMKGDIKGILNKQQVKLTEPRKKPSYFPLSWFFNRDPFTGL